jgi:hypothetical protein
MRGQQVCTGMGCPFRQFLVSGKGIADLLNFTGLRQYPFTREHCCDLFETQRVTFDSQ